MPATSPPDSTLSWKLSLLRREQIAQALQIGIMDGRQRSLEHSMTDLIRHLRAGPPPSSTPPPSATPGTPSPRWEGLIERASRISRYVSVAAGVFKALAMIIPHLMLVAAALWKLVLPYLSRLLGLF